jgi:hypothetical protein
MFMVGNTPQEPNPTLGGEKRPRLGKCDLLAGAFFQPPTVNAQWQLEKNPFLNEQSWNVIENKGSLWKTGRRSRNVLENTRT